MKNPNSVHLIFIQVNQNVLIFLKQPVADPENSLGAGTVVVEVDHQCPLMKCWGGLLYILKGGGGFHRFATGSI